VHGVFSPTHIYTASSRQIQFHWVPTRDNRGIVTLFMQDGNYPPRNFATLGSLLLQPMFTGTSSDNRRVTTHNSRALIKGQSVYMGYSPLHRPVFLVNSRSKQLCVIEDFWSLRPSFSRSYRSILSSSLSRVFSITLVDLLLDHHCRFRVRFIFLCFFLSPFE